MLDLRYSKPGPHISSSQQHAKEVLESEPLPDPPPSESLRGGGEAEIPVPIKVWQVLIQTKMKCLLLSSAGLDCWVLYSSRLQSLKTFDGWNKTILWYFLLLLFIPFYYSLLTRVGSVAGEDHFGVQYNLQNGLSDLQIAFSYLLLLMFMHLSILFQSQRNSLEVGTRYLQIKAHVTTNKIEPCECV